MNKVILHLKMTIEYLNMLSLLNSLIIPRIVVNILIVKLSFEVNKWLIRSSIRL
jgi:hypothetical protein